MNLISFTNFNISDNQTSFLPSTEKDEKAEDFSALLNNIFVALQTANSPVTNFSSGFEKDTFQFQTISEKSPNVVLGNNQNVAETTFTQNTVLLPNTDTNLQNTDTNLSLSFPQTTETVLPISSNTEKPGSLLSSKADTETQNLNLPIALSIPSAQIENLLSIPNNFQPTAKLPTMQNFAAEKTVKGNSPENITNQSVTENLQIASSAKQNTDKQILNLDSTFPIKDFEILPQTEKNNPFSQLTFTNFPTINNEQGNEQNLNLLQVFKTVSNSIRENNFTAEVAPKVKTLSPLNNIVEAQKVSFEVKTPELPTQITEIPLAKNKVDFEVINPQIVPQVKSKPTDSASEQNINETIDEVKTDTSNPPIPQNTFEDLETILPVNVNLESKSNLILERPESFTKVAFVEPNKLNLETESAETLIVQKGLPRESSPIKAEPQANIEVTANLDSKLTVTESEKVINSDKKVVNSETRQNTEMVLEPQADINFSENHKTETEINQLFNQIESKILSQSESKVDSPVNLDLKPELKVVQPKEVLTNEVSSSEINYEVKPAESNLPEYSTAQFTEPKTLNLSNDSMPVENTFESSVVSASSESDSIDEPRRPELINQVFVSDSIDENSSTKIINETVAPIAISEAAKPILVNQSPALNLNNKTFDAALVNETVRPNLVETTAPVVDSPQEASVLLSSLIEETKPFQAKTEKTKVFSKSNDFASETIKVSENTESGTVANLSNPTIQQTDKTPLSEQIQADDGVKIENAELSPKLGIQENENPKKKIDLNENENDISINFDKTLENTVKESKTIETTLKNQVEPAKLAEQINPHLLKLAVLVEKKNQKEILKLRLHPAELGTVEITLERNSSGVLNAHFTTDNESARQVLSNSLEQLRDSLQKAGWEIGQLDISNGSSSSTTNQDSENNQRKSDWVEDFAFSRSSEKPDETEQNSPNRLLNLLA